MTTQTKTNDTLIGIQDAYVAKLNGARRKAVGYKQRSAVRLIEAQAWKAGLRALKALGFTSDQAIEAMVDARDVADLEINAHPTRSELHEALAAGVLVDKVIAAINRNNEINAEVK